MAGHSALGAFGLEVSLLQVLFHLPLFAHVITATLQCLLEEGCVPPLLATLLTAILKDFPAAAASDWYIPISVTWVWYHLIMHVFVYHMSPIVLLCISDWQHGFCLGRSTMTAFLGALPVLELGSRG